MLERIKRRCRSDTALLYPFLAVQAVVLALSLSGINLGFWPKTTLAKLHEQPLVNALLVLVIVVGLIELALTRAEARAAHALVFAGFLWGIGAACAFAFDVGLFGAYLLAGANLYRLNTARAVAVAHYEKANNPLEPTRWRARPCTTS